MSRNRNRASAVTLSCRIERKDARLPRFVVVPAPLLEAWRLEGTTVVEATLNDAPIGRRSLKRWDDDRWFIDLTQPMCERAGVGTGDRVQLSMRVASDALPAELAALLAGSALAQTAWAKLTTAQQRMLREEITAAKSTATRRRRAQRGLGLSTDGTT